MAHPLTSVGFIEQLDPYPGAVLSSAYGLCVVIGPGSMWNTGDDPYALTRQIISHFQMTLDGVVLPSDDIIFNSILTDYDGPVGAAGGAITACVQKKQETGLRLVSIETRSLSGNVFSYDWAFRIDPNVAIDYATKVRPQIDPFSASARQ